MATEDSTKLMLRLKSERIISSSGSWIIKSRPGVDAAGDSSGINNQIETINSEVYLGKPNPYQPLSERIVIIKGSKGRVGRVEEFVENKLEPKGWSYKAVRFFKYIYCCRKAKEEADKDVISSETLTPNLPFWEYWDNAERTMSNIELINDEDKTEEKQNVQDSDEGTNKYNKEEQPTKEREGTKE